MIERTSPAAKTNDERELPAIFRAASFARRILGAPGTRLLYGSPFAAPLRRALAARAPDGFTLVEICGGPLQGARFWADLSCEKYYWLGTHEEHVQTAIAEYVRPGSVVYDIGAHAGFFSLLAGRAAGPTGLVLAFEPLPANVQRLADNLAANAAKNVKFMPIAIADEDGEAPFDEHASSLEGALGGAAGGLTVNVRSIDSLAREDVPPPDVIKIDVEGAEGRVLRGARETLQNHRPIVLVEVHSDEAGIEVTAELWRYGFLDLRTGLEAKTPPAPGHYAAFPRRAAVS